ncbi:hypothetical protein Tsubulata_018014 [Turnera subulata]|uniref:Uncharacterized protein n=1 Tax=Turnera subulata TaxID=218843 RepID=A0A9Q0GFD4_9ROSI|nr:hypothetical protein Tsubulata_018014 [Turnera subulata]
MFKRLRLLVGRNQKTSPKVIPDNANHQTCAPQTLHEVAIYIHRFHNLDLFQQGWYQIKISMRLEDNENTSLGTPARVVQYEAPVPGSQGAYGVWRIDDVENSFSSQPFWIKYARQDIYLSIMVSFFLCLEGLLTSSVIVKFELMYSPALENGSDLQGSLNSCPASSHEFRIPPRALLGSHSYCPVHFDAFHTVLVDLSVHISMLRASLTPDPKETSEMADVKSKQVLLIKTLKEARDILIDDLEKMSRAIDQAIDLASFISSMDGAKFGSTPQLNLGAADKASVLLYKPQNCVKDDLVDSCRRLGDQIVYLWNLFFMFHRANKTKILEFLRDAWAGDRRVEWSIWMPAQSASMRAELHRQSIAQMKINNRTFQDMHIFEDPSRIPIVIVEHIMSVPQNAPRGYSCGSDMDFRDASQPLTGTDFGAGKASNMSCSEQNDRILKIVVFVHGFQAWSTFP